MKHSVGWLKFLGHVISISMYWRRWIHFRWEIYDRKSNECTYCARADIIVTQITENGAACPKWPRFIGKWVLWSQRWCQILNRK